jgi:hypothetical protein
MKTVGQMQAFLVNRDQHGSTDRNTGLRLDRVLGGPKNVLIRKRCLIRLKNNSTCQRWRHRSAIDSGLRAKLLVKNAIRLPLSSLTTTRRSVAG